MNIQTVKTNLEKTIASKEKMLIKNELRLKEVKMDVFDRVVCESVTRMLRLNIDELRRILQDVEQCIEETV
jgi:hypothetical protein